MDGKDRSQEMRGWGYFLAIMEKALEASGSRLKETERDSFLRFPRGTFAMIYKRAMACDAITDEVEFELAGALDLVDGSEEARGYGTKDHPISAHDLSTLMMACCHYSTDRVSVKQAAEELGVSTQRVYKMLAEGKLEGIEIKGGRTVFASSVRRRKAESDG